MKVHFKKFAFILLQARNSECLSRFKAIPDNQVFISIPGDYSRKPPIGGIFPCFAHLDLNFWFGNDTHNIILSGFKNILLFQKRKRRKKVHDNKNFTFNI